MYDQSGAGRMLADYTFCSLSLWHSYKQSCLTVWKLFATTFIAPLFHAIFPNKLFRVKNKLSAVVHMLTAIRIAYPGFRPQLDAALAIEDLPQKDVTHLKNLQCLCEFLIPQVNNCCMLHTKLF
jgi:hypothetical protein